MGRIYIKHCYKLCDYQCKRHIVYTDNYYTSLKLSKYLLSCQTDLVGTIGKTSRGFPHINTIRFGQGENIKLANDDSIVACGLVDKRDVYCFLTIAAGDEVDVSVSRFNTTSRQLKPAMLLDYSKYMGGVDKLYQARSYYNMGRKCRKYWKYILYNVFNMHY